MVAERKNYGEKNILNNLNKLYGEVAEGFKAVDCKSIEFSHRRFESYLLFVFRFEI